MQNANTGMIEIIDAEKSGDDFFSIAKRTIDDAALTIRMSISEIDYFYIKEIISFQPFKDKSVSPYRYFFTGSYEVDVQATEYSTIFIRVEQQRKNKQFGFRMSSIFVANLLWFALMDEKPLLALLQSLN